MPQMQPYYSPYGHQAAMPPFAYNPHPAMQGYAHNPLYPPDAGSHIKPIMHSERFGPWLDPNTIPAEQMAIENAVMSAAMIHDNGVAIRQQMVGDVEIASFASSPGFAGYSILTFPEYESSSRHGQQRVSRLRLHASATDTRWRPLQLWL